MTALTPRQRQVVAFVVEFTTRGERPPTIREIAAHLDITSTNGTSDHLKACECKGYLERRGKRSVWWAVKTADGVPIRWRLVAERVG